MEEPAIHCRIPMLIRTKQPVLQVNGADNMGAVLDASEDCVKIALAVSITLSIGTVRSQFTRAPLGVGGVLRQPGDFQ